MSSGASSDPKRFGILGRLYRRKFTEFLRAMSGAAEAEQIEVRVFGSKPRNARSVTQVSYLTSAGSHLPRLDLEAELRQMAALIYLYREGDFRVSMSGAFFESLAHGIPALFSKQPSMSQANDMAAGGLGIEFQSPGHVARALQSKWLAEDLRELRIQLPDTLRTWNNASAAELQAALGY